MEVKLSNRLKAIASFITPGAFFSDIGSDHAYLPCYVCKHDKLAKAIAGEVQQGPYERARLTVERMNLTEQIDVRLGSGLSVIKKTDQVTEVVIAGMGGSLIKQILQADKDKLGKVERLILQPNTNSNYVRKFLLDNQYTLIDELILEENNHIYEILVASKNEKASPYNQTNDDIRAKQLLFGPFLLEERNKVFFKKWQLEHQKLGNVLQQLTKAKVVEESKFKEIKRQMEWIEEVIYE